MPARTELRNRLDVDGLSSLDASITKVLDPAEERAILGGLAECRKTLADAMKRLPGGSEATKGSEALAHYVAQLREDAASSGPRLGAVARRYEELRSKLALANMRLVAHVAKGFRERGISQADLLQEGFRGLLEAIDRFDLGHETKLATYATWWIRQAMQCAVASGAYPVRLSPRHLRQLARNQAEIERGGEPKAEGDANPASPEMIRRIHAATRPTVSLDGTRDGRSEFASRFTTTDSEDDPAADVDTDEAVSKLMATLRPREQEVLELRYGLSGKPRLSLSQVGKVMSVSKERVRQIQDRALAKLRQTADAEGLEEVFAI